MLGQQQQRLRLPGAKLQMLWEKKWMLGQQQQRLRRHALLPGMSQLQTEQLAHTHLLLVRTEQEHQVQMSQDWILATQQAHLLQTQVRLPVLVTTLVLTHYKMVSWW